MPWHLLKTLLEKQVEIAKAYPDETPDKTIELWCRDETRVGQKGRCTHGWAATGSRPPGPIDTRYANASIFGAFCPARDTAVGLIRPRADTAMMQLHLDEISAQLPPHVHAAMIGDGA